jgi:hypothetical protein
MPDPGDISDLIYNRSGGTCYNSSLCNDYEDEDYWPGERDKSDKSSAFWAWGQLIDHTFTLTETTDNERLYTGRGRLAGKRSRYIIDEYGRRQQINSLSPFIDGSAIYGSDYKTQRMLKKQPRYLGYEKTHRATLCKLRYSRNPYHRDYPRYGSYTQVDGYEHMSDRSLLPYDRSNGHYMAGDVRAEEHVVLTSMHTLWMREHNYWCERLAKEHETWNSDKLYLHARNIVAGEIQAITYNEWLPLLLGTSSLYSRHPCYKVHHHDVEMNAHDDGYHPYVGKKYSSYGHSYISDPQTGGYDPTSAFSNTPEKPLDGYYTQQSDEMAGQSSSMLTGHYFQYVQSYLSDEAQLFNEFSTAAFRFGHTMVVEELDYRDPWTGHLDYSLPLKELFFQSQPVPYGSIWKDNIDGWLLGAIKQPCNKITPRLVDSLRSHLFEHVHPPETMDLVARNIARGRDHSLPSYQKMYTWTTGLRMRSCYQMTESRTLCRKIQSLYGLEGDIDLFVGITCEKKKPGSMLGYVGSEIIAKQFDIIRNTDPYFYLWNDLVTEYKSEIHSTTLADIIKRNTIITPAHIQKNVFLIPEFHY